MNTLKNKRLFLLDMDGTIYLDNELFDGTIDFLEYVKSIGGRYIFLTNNSSKSVDKYIEKLDKFEKSDDRALETAWQMIGRGSMYDVANRIYSIYETTAEDVKDLAEKVFRGSYPTYIAALPKNKKVDRKGLLFVFGADDG